MWTPAASRSQKGSHEEMAEGREEKIAVKSSTPSAKECGVTADMEVHDTTSRHANPIFLSCKVDESDNIPHFEDSYPQMPVCYDEVPIGRVTGSVEDADKTNQVQIVDAYGSLGSSLNDQKFDCSIEDSVIGSGSENTMVDELMLSVVNTVPCVPNSSSTEDGNNIMGLGDVDFLECHSENYVEDSYKYITVSVGTSVSATGEARVVSLDCSIGPFKEERKCDVM